MYFREQDRMSLSEGEERKCERRVVEYSFLMAASNLIRRYLPPFESLYVLSK